jgi:CBS domain-containing protein
LLVKDIETKKIIAVKRSTSLAELLGLFKNFHTFPLVPVVEEGDRLVGVVSFKNLIDVFRPSRPEILRTVPFLDEGRENIFEAELTEEMGSLLVVDDIMETNYLSIQEDANLKKAYDLMQLHSLNQLPVVDNQGRLTGIIGIFDIVLALFKERGIINIR